MNTSPKVSVLMCNYNYGDFIGQAIQSVLDQSLSDFELIIVDDGSTDHSASEIARFDDERIKPVFQENGGQAAAFNAGFRHCKGDLIAFIDSDDWWLPHKLESVLLALTNSRSRIGLVQHQVTIWHDGKERPYKRVLPCGDCFEEMKATGNLDYFSPTSAITIPTEVCKRIFPIPKSLRICADAFLTRSATAFGLLLSIPEVLAYYRQHNNTVFLNTEFGGIELFNEEIIPKLNEFYASNGFADARIAQIPTPGHASQAANPGKRSIRQRVLGKLAHKLQKIAEA